MIRTMIVTVVVVCASALTAAGGGPDKEREDRVEEAHRALEEAVELVRATHSPEGNVWFSNGRSNLVRSSRPRIGVVVRTSAFENEPMGAVIDAVTPGGPADEAGLRAGDVITHFDGQALVEGDAGEASRALAGRKLVELSRGFADGQTVTIDFLRDGRAMSAVLTVREMNGGPWMLESLPRYREFVTGADLHSPGATPVRWSVPSAWLDMELVALNPALGEYFNADRGVLVVRAPEDDSLGLEAGDVILAIGGREVRDPSHAMRILRLYEPDEELRLNVVRHGRSQALVGTVPQPSVELFGGAHGVITEAD